MAEQTQDNLTQTFLKSDRKHVLMITNHGIHQWNVIPGLPDTGGQNVFVNQFTDSLAQFGFKITIVNRGGFPNPKTGELHTGLRYKNRHERILYIEDDTKEFIRKEDMNSQTPELAEFLKDHLDEEGLDVDLIISHYWDAAKIGVLFNRKLDERVKHIWVPHSLGEVKKRNMSPETWDDLRIHERIEVENNIIPELDGIAATSSLIRQSLKEDYGYTSEIFLPPCVKADRFYSRDISPDHEIWQFLHQHTGLSAGVIRDSYIVTEISRTDKTKRKDILIKAFQKVRQEVPQSLLIVSIDETEEQLAAELKNLIADLEIQPHVAVVGNVWDRLPYIYSVTSVYCSPSVMEGFGMAVQEAAATQVPVVGSDRIPFVEEYLLGDEVEQISYDGERSPSLAQGDGAIMVPADDVEGFAYALTLLLKDENLRQKMGENAYNITIPYFTWSNMVERFLETIDFEIPHH